METLARGIQLMMIAQSIHPDKCVDPRASPNLRMPLNQRAQNKINTKDSGEVGRPRETGEE